MGNGAAEKGNTMQRDGISSNEDENEWQVVSLQETKKQAAKEHPREDFTWDDQAIVHCFELAVNSHLQGGAQQQWEASSTKNQTEFSPKTIPLPSWAVDSFLQLPEHEQKKQSVENGESK